MEKDQALKKHQAITKFGTPVRVHKKLKGVVIKSLPDGYYKVSTGNSGVNWTDTLHLNEIEVWK